MQNEKDPLQRSKTTQNFGIDKQDMLPGIQFCTSGDVLITLSYLLLPGPVCSGMIGTVNVPSVGQIIMFKNYSF